VREIADINLQHAACSMQPAAAAMPFMPAAAATTVIVTIKLANDIKARQG